MRVLANQFETEVRDWPITPTDLTVSVQTGERSEDPTVRADLVFTTIDQTLSNVLCVPYALSRGRANLNAGAVLSSYLVFDEYHLFPPEGAFGTP